MDLSYPRALFARRRRRLLAAALAAGLVAALLPATASSAAASITAVDDPQQASAAARSSGHRVETMKLRTETSQTFANPDGSFTQEQATVPQFVHRADGSWASVDTDLARRPDGVVAPKATTADLRLSDGGNSPLVTFTRDRSTFTLAWPTALPKPSLAGDTATYSEVLPGVDLTVRALADGFTHVLVVKSAEAATQPGLAELKYRLGGTGVQIAPTAEGGLSVKGKGGAPLIQSGGALMWDSNTSDAPGGRTVADAGKGAVADKSSHRAPGDLAARSQAHMSVASGELKLAPDARLLTGAHTVYPVYVDPVFSYSKWAYANNTNMTNSDGKAWVGKDPVNGNIYRSFFQYSISSLTGKKITAANLATTLWHSWSCTSTPASLYRTNGISATPRVSWSSMTLSKYLDTRSGHANKSGGCGANEPDMPMEFGGNLLSDLQAAANSGWTTYVVGLTARKADGTGESTTDRWKKFIVADTKLVVTYNSYPTVQSSSLKTNGYACVTGVSRPRLGVDPTASAIGVDAENGNVTMTFQRAHIKADGTYETITPLGTVTKASGTAATKQLTGLSGGNSYAWQVMASDSSGLSSAWSAWCEFTVDTSAPTVTPKITSTDGLVQECPEGSQDCPGSGMPGQTASFTFAPKDPADPADVSDIVAYEWGWTDTPTTRVGFTQGQTTTVKLTMPSPLADDPTSGGELRLRVRSVDGAGNRGPVYSYRFMVGSAGPAATWLSSWDDGSTANLTDATGGGKDAISTNTAWSATANQHVPGDASMSFNGTSSKAATSAPVVTPSQSFTVTAWARTTGADGTYRNVLAQSGPQTSLFGLGMSSGGKWAFWWHPTLDGSTATVVSTAATVKPNVWTHLAGTYDAVANQITLYVNGVKVGTAALPAGSVLTADGSFTIGHGRYANADTYFWNGDIDDVQAHNRIMSPAEVEAVALAAVGRWRMDEGSDLYAYDGAGYGSWMSSRDMTVSLSGTGASWTADKSGATALQTDGVTGSAQTTSAVVRTNQSFTVSAWVRLDRKTGFQAVWSQDGGLNSAAYMRYQDNYTNGIWVFGMTNAADSTGVQVAAYQQTVAIGTWTHLTGVYDATAGQMKLYVNGVLGGSTNTATYTMTWDGGDVFAIGRMKYRGNINTYFCGAIDDLRAWQSALTADQVTRVYNSAL